MTKKKRVVVAAEINFHGMTVEEALPKLEQYLNDAFVAGLYHVTIIHGKGTGTLREIVRRYVGRHTLVRAFRQGERSEGGEGVTVVELALK